MDQGRIITSKFANKCRKCKENIDIGSKLYYLPSFKSAFCLKCMDKVKEEFKKYINKINK